MSATSTLTTKKKFTKYIAVIVDLSIGKTLHYGLNEEQASQVHIGSRVEVLVRGFLRKGIIEDVLDSSPFPKVLGILRLLPDEASIPQDLFLLGKWMANYYGATLNRIFCTIVPTSVRNETGKKQQYFVSALKTKEQLREFCIKSRAKAPLQASVIEQLLRIKKGMFLTELLEKSRAPRSSISALEKKGLLKLESMNVDASPLANASYFMTSPKTLTDEQGKALEKVNTSIKTNTFETHLLFGITGSGKTEIYLQAIEKALSLGKGSIVLVPEIALTAQTVERFRSRFNEKIAILHYRLSQGERFEQWQNIRQGKARIVIGARSAIFSPVPNLGLIIVDEEHERTYKQSDEAPNYHARDVAVMRGHLTKSAVILGSATPSLESYYNAQLGKYTLSVLSKRPTKSSLPKTTIINMTKEYEKAQGFTNFSQDLLSGIEARAKKGEKSILFLNRRGYHTSMICLKCSNILQCKDCDVSLTYHKNSNSLQCHLCGYSKIPPKKCPKCHTFEEPFKFRGVGTELIERQLRAIFPEIRTIRMDADTTRHKGSLEKLFRDFRTGKADVLIGTQMIAKGLHFPDVTLVGVLNSDSSLNLPDFRSSENVFQLITQVAGRAGRGVLEGEVIIQTCMPENQTLQLAAKQDFEGFYKEEIASREIFEYPPFSHMAKVIFSGEHEPQVLQIANHFQKHLQGSVSKLFEVYPVLPTGHSKIKGNFRFQFLIRTNKIYELCKRFHQVRSGFKYPSQVRIKLDIDPSSTYF